MVYQMRAVECHLIMPLAVCKKFPDHKGLGDLFVLRILLDSLLLAGLKPRAVICDSPVRSLLSGMLSVTSINGCRYCEATAEKVQIAVPDADDEIESEQSQVDDVEEMEGSGYETESWVPPANQLLARGSARGRVRGQAGRGASQGRGRGQAGRGASQGRGRGQAGRGADQGRGRGQAGRGADQGRGRGQAGRGANQRRARGQAGRGASQGRGRGQAGRGANQGRGRGQAGRGANQGRGRGQAGRGASQGRARGQAGGGEARGTGHVSRSDIRVTARRNLGRASDRGNRRGSARTTRSGLGDEEEGLGDQGRRQLGRAEQMIERNLLASQPQRRKRQVPTTVVRKAKRRARPLSRRCWPTSTMGKPRRTSDLWADTLALLRQQISDGTYDGSGIKGIKAYTPLIELINGGFDIVTGLPCECMHALDEVRDKLINYLYFYSTFILNLLKLLGQ